MMPPNTLHPNGLLSNTHQASPSSSWRPQMGMNLAQPTRIFGSIS